MKSFGFFRELAITGSTGPSIRDHVAETPMDHAPEAARYLRSCPVIASFPVLSPNVLDAGRDAIRGCSIHTDGTWVWPSDMAVYVEQGLQPPAEFVERMRASDWTPPQLTDQTVRDVRNEVFGRRPRPQAELD